MVHVKRKRVIAVQFVWSGDTNSPVTQVYSGFGFQWIRKVKHSRCAVVCVGISQFAGNAGAINCPISSIITSDRASSPCLKQRSRLPLYKTTIALSLPSQTAIAPLSPVKQRSRFPSSNTDRASFPFPKQRSRFPSLSQTAIRLRLCFANALPSPFQQQRSRLQLICFV